MAAIVCVSIQPSFAGVTVVWRAPPLRSLPPSLPSLHLLSSVQRQRVLLKVRFLINHHFLRERDTHTHTHSHIDTRKHKHTVNHSPLTPRPGYNYSELPDVSSLPSSPRLAPGCPIKMIILHHRTSMMVGNVGSGFVGEALV